MEFKSRRRLLSSLLATSTLLAKQIVDWSAIFVTCQVLHIWKQSLKLTQFRYIRNTIYEVLTKPVSLAQIG